MEAEDRAKGPLELLPRVIGEDVLSQMQEALYLRVGFRNKLDHQPPADPAEKLSDVLEGKLVGDGQVMQQAKREHPVRRPPRLNPTISAPGSCSRLAP